MTKNNAPAIGARPLARLIQENIKKPLAEELLFGKLAKGGAVAVDLEDGALTFDCREDKTPKKGGKRAKDSALVE